jgi:hypothetical protein
LRTLSLVLILMAICLPALAVGKVTADPNASAAVVAKPDEDMATDARLSQKVTLSESRKCASVILEDLTKLTGVTFKTGVNNNDWQVRDRKMNLFVKDVPLAQVMNSISHVMKFKWERKGDAGKWQYRLYMDRRTLLDADAQRLREDERLRDKASAKRKAGLDDYMNADNLSPVDRAKLKETDPLMYLFATTGIAGSIGQMFREVPALNEAMATGGEISIAGKDMSQQGKAGLSRLLSSIINLVRKMKPNEQSIPDSIDPNLVTVELNRDLDRQSGGLPQGLLLAMFNVKLGENDKANLPLMNPDSAIGHALGNALIKCADGQVKAEDLDKTIQSDIQAAALKDIEALRQDWGEPEVQHPDDPALKTKMKLAPEGDRFADIQKALADASSFAVISDSFGKMQDGGMLGFVKDENELGTMLDKLCGLALYNWEKRTSVIEFRDREWFRKRSAQIPEATLEVWRQAFIKTGTLDLGDLGQMARLDVAQYNQNVGEDEVLGSVDLSRLIWLQRDMLRVYASLTENQRSAALSDARLDLQSLPPDQFAVAQQMLRARNVKFLDKPDAQVTLKMTRKPEAKQFHYTFTIATTDDLPAIKSEFTTPKYQEPKKPDKPADKAKHADVAQPAKQP